jgi:uncharacterized protein (TIGR00369 family)
MNAPAPRFTPKDPAFEARVRASFLTQRFLTLVGATLEAVRPGYVEMHLPGRPDVRQQHGYFHGGAIATIFDSASAYAAFTLIPPHETILTVEYKLNLLAPGKGDRLIVRAQVVKPGRTLTVVQADAFGASAEGESLCATTMQTLMAVPERPLTPPD